MSEGAIEPARVYRPVRQASPARRTRGYQQTYNTRQLPRPQQAAPRTAPRPPSAAKTAAAGGASAGAAGAATGYAAGTAADAARAADRARIPTGNRQYQSVILAEFLIAVVVVAGFPIVTGGSPNAQAKGSPSPYDVTDLRQLVALGGVYFILALLSSGNRGRLAAWFGGLVLVGLAFSKYPLFKTAAQNLTVTPDTGLGDQAAQTAEGAV